MKTKTPKQIHDQWLRLAKNARTAINIERVKRAAEISTRYRANIYRANGIENVNTCTDTAKCNYIWEHAATPASVYAK